MSGTSKIHQKQTHTRTRTRRGSRRTASGTRKVQSTISSTSSAPPPPLLMPAPQAALALSIDGHTIQQQTLAREAGVSKSVISRMFSVKLGMSRKDPKLSTLRKLQVGLQRLTGQHYPLDFIGELITGRTLD